MLQVVELLEEIVHMRLIVIQKNTYVGSHDSRIGTLVPIIPLLDFSESTWSFNRTFCIRLHLYTLVTHPVTYTISCLVCHDIASCHALVVGVVCHYTSCNCL